MDFPIDTFNIISGYLHNDDIISCSKVHARLNKSVKENFHENGEFLSSLISNNDFENVEVYLSMYKCSDLYKMFIGIKSMKMLKILYKIPYLKIIKPFDDIIDIIYGIRDNVKYNEDFIVDNINEITKFLNELGHETPSALFPYIDIHLVSETLENKSEKCRIDSIIEYIIKTNNIQLMKILYKHKEKVVLDMRIYHDRRISDEMLELILEMKFSNLIRIKHGLVPHKLDNNLLYDYIVQALRLGENVYEDDNYDPYLDYNAIMEAMEFDDTSERSKHIKHTPILHKALEGIKSNFNDVNMDIFPELFLIPDVAEKCIELNILNMSINEYTLIDIIEGKRIHAQKLLIKHNIPIHDVDVLEIINVIERNERFISFEFMQYILNNIEVPVDTKIILNHYHSFTYPMLNLLHSKQLLKLESGLKCEIHLRDPDLFKVILSVYPFTDARKRLFKNICIMNGYHNTLKLLD